MIVNSQAVTTITDDIPSRVGWGRREGINETLYPRDGEFSCGKTREWQLVTSSSPICNVLSVISLGIASVLETSQESAKRRVKAEGGVLKTCSLLEK